MPTHEAYAVEGGRAETLPASVMTFSEEQKTPEQYRAKVERDREILERFTQEHPDNPRGWYYLGDTYTGLGEDELAKNAFYNCFELEGWDEESAWSCYRIAEIYCKWNDYGSALHWCALGMSRHSGMAELPWLAGFCCWKMGRFNHAIYWENMAVALNAMGAEEDRINFRHEPALHEGPFDVLRYAHREIGEDVEADIYEEAFRDQLEQRLGPQ